MALANYKVKSLDNETKSRLNILEIESTMSHHKNGLCTFTELCYSLTSFGWMVDLVNVNIGETYYIKLSKWKDFDNIKGGSAPLGTVYYNFTKGFKERWGNK